jgi:hypothetical protein
LSKASPEYPEFLWSPYIPFGALTLVVGRGGIGKSWLTTKIAADLSAGRALPGQPAMPPMKVLIISAEESPGYLLTKMQHLGANYENILTGSSEFTLDTAGLKAVEEAIKQVKAVFVVLDPMVSFLGGKLNMNNSNEVRAIVGPLHKIAQRNHCALVVVHHTRKDSRGPGAEKAMGSADFGNMARSILLVEPRDDGVRLVTHEKHNMSPEGASLGYRVVLADGDISGPAANAAPGKFEWVDITTKKVVPRSGRLDVAKQLLFDLLKDGARPAAEVLAAAKEIGISPRTLDTAKRESMIVSIRRGSAWYWALEEKKDIGLPFREPKPAPTFPDWYPRLEPKTLPADPDPQGTRDRLGVLGRGPLTPPPSAPISKQAPETEIERLIREAKERMPNRANP